MVLLKSGVLLSNGKDATSHGAPYDYDARVPLILKGPGIRAGLYETPVMATSLAPTLGRLLEVPFSAAEDSLALEEALQPSDPMVSGKQRE